MRRSSWIPSVLVPLGVAAGCSSADPAQAPAQPATRAAEPTTPAAPLVDAASPPPSCPAGAKLANGACTSNGDCVLTDLAAVCDACNLDKPYPTLRTTLEERDRRCASTPPCTAGCPPHDTYLPAFYRAECRSGRCIAWRYHGGG